MRLLYYGESPLNPTGFGTVNRHVLAACSQVADQVTLVASTHYHESYDRCEYPYEIIPCVDRADQRNLPNIMKHVQALDWDVFFYQGDMGPNNDVLEVVGKIQEEHPEKTTIFYMPVDGDVSLGFAFRPFTWCSAPVVYTHHAKSVVERYAPDIAKNVSVIWLGCQVEDFYPLSDDDRRQARLEFFGESFMDTFICINVNRNQLRKDLARSMGAFHLFHEQCKNSMLYMHSVQNDAGGSLPLQAQLVDCRIWEKPAEVTFSSLDLANPWPRESLNRMYNAVALKGCLVSTAYGEGWGLTTTEAMCAGLPAAVPYNTANLDILGENDYSVKLAGAYQRGYGFKTGGDLDHTTFNYANGGGPVPHVHANSFMRILRHMYYNPEKIQKKAEVARQWCLENTWQHRENEWIQLLQLIKQQVDNQSPVTTIS